MSEVKVNKISPRSGTNVQLGDSGDTITVPSGATLDASNATTTLPANVVTTTGSQTLTNKTIGSSQLTGALPALDGSALTGIPDTIAPTRHSIRPSLNLDFANSKALDPRITFTRASNATYYDGYTTVKAEENLVSYSQEFNSWNTARTTVTANDTTAPDGTTTADAVYDNTENLPHYVYIDSSSFFTTYIYNVSCYVKNNGSDTVVIQLGVSGLNACTFNVSTGVVTGTGGNCSQATITDVGNSWYRCSFQVDTVTANGNRYFVFLKNSSSYVGTGTDGLYLWGFQVEQRDSLTAYTPTTTTPITKYQPALQTAGNNVARFDHNPTTGESLGLLIEEQRTNLNTSSEIHTATENGTSTLNELIAPDGTLTADRFNDNTTAGRHRVYISSTITVTDGVTYTYSVYVKIGLLDTVNYIGLVESSGALWVNAIFDPSNNWSYTLRNADSASAVDIGNGWYRLSMTATRVGTGSALLQVAFYTTSSSTSISSYTGTGYNHFYTWGAQVEQGSFPTSYIKTTGSQVTRSADFCKMENIDTSEWFKQGEGTAYVEATGFYGGGSYPRIFSISDGTNNNRIDILRLSTTPTESTDKYYYIEINDAGQSESLIGNGDKILISYKLNDLKVVSQGNTVVTDTAGVLIGNLTTLYLGNDATGQSQEGFGYIKKFSYYPLALTSNEITDLSEE